MDFKQKFTYIVAGILFLYCANVQGRGFFHRADSLLTEWYRLGKSVDTAYIVRPPQKMSVSAYATVFRSDLSLHGAYRKSPYYENFKSQSERYFSLYYSYKGVTLGYSVNPAKVAGKYHDNEFSFNSYGSAVCLEFNYHHAKDLNGVGMMDSSVFHIEEGLIDQRSINANLFFVFNNKKFSYPAAFGNSYIQEKSAGGILIGMSYMHTKTQTMGGTLIGDYGLSLKINMVGIGAGYGRNWVPVRNLLIHVSGLPTLGIFEKHEIKTANHLMEGRKFPNFIIAARSAVVYNFGRWFTSGSCVVQYATQHFDYDYVSVVEYMKWNWVYSVGLRF